MPYRFALRYRRTPSQGQNRTAWDKRESLMWSWQWYNICYHKNHQLISTSIMAKGGKEMFDLDRLSKLRFGMSEVPKVGGQPGIYEEKWSQWFLERSFFRDFVYRNPRGAKKGQELADAVVLFEDVALMVQVKAQHGRHDPMSWATEKLLEAFKQLRKTHENFVQGPSRS
jgi:hypothetical protein